MQKIEFKNFPDLTTPLSASNLNTLQDNVENVFNGSTPMGNIVVDSIRSKNIIPVEQQFTITTSQSVYVNIPVGTYTISGKITGDSNYYSLIIFNKNGNELTSCALDHSGNLTQQTITLSDTADEIVLYSNSNWSTSNGQTSTFNELQLEKGSTATSYVPYQNLSNIPKIEYSYLLSRGIIQLTGLTPWTAFTLPFSNDANAEFGTNNSNDFERDGNTIKCKFSGKILIIRQVSHNNQYETDISDDFGGFLGLNGHDVSAVEIFSVSNNDKIGIIINMGMEALNIYNARLIIVRLQ